VTGPARALADFAAWLEAAPAGTQLDARAVLAVVRAAQPSAGSGPGSGGADRGAPCADDPASPPPAASWRERLWTVPAETRLGAREVAEALGRPKSWVHRRTAPKAAECGAPRLPHRKIDGALIFLAGEIRTWVAEHEEVVVAAPRSTRALPLRPDVRRPVQGTIGKR
jgi:hypothetical protein